MPPRRSTGPRRPTETPLYRVIQHHLETFLAEAEQRDGRGVPPWVEHDFRRYLTCGILAHGFARLRCDACAQERLLAFSCKGRGVGPSCATRRMAEVAAHLTDHVIPYVPARQWVLSLPKRLRPSCWGCWSGWRARWPLGWQETRQRLEAGEGVQHRHRNTKDEVLPQTL